VLPDVILWQDEMKRDGPANMAIDEWLWFHSAKPVLRIYQWQSDWLSIGYFSKSSEVPKDQKFVRRPTGGGVVEHGRDWAYTLIVPRGHDLAERPGAESYSVIHQALAHVLRMEGQVCSLLAQSQPRSSDYCFVHAVAHDLIDQEGQKLAGAGQRRGKNGLLHQGSVQGGGALMSCAVSGWRVDWRIRSIHWQFALIHHGLSDGSRKFTQPRHGITKNRRVRIRFFYSSM
jgi:lipoate-protein ligase A